MEPIDTALLPKKATTPPVNGKNSPKAGTNGVSKQEPVEEDEEMDEAYDAVLESLRAEREEVHLLHFHTFFPRLIDKARKHQDKRYNLIQ